MKVSKRELDFCYNKLPGDFKNIVKEFNSLTTQENST
jgi:hypothetical protein